MATSDSEDFESADEDVEDSKTLSVEKSTLNHGNNSIRRSDVSSSSCSSTLTSSGGDVALATDAEVDRLEKTKSDVDENQPLISSVGELEIVDDAKSKHSDTRDKRNGKSRHQKPKQLKPAGMRKLGTKIVSATKQPETVNLSSSGDHAEGDVDNPASTGSVDSNDIIAQQGSRLDRETGSRGQGDNFIGSAADEKSVTSDTLPDNSSEKGWSGWGGWGVSSLLSSATEGMASLTSQVSQGLSTVLEAGIGAPDPEELARMQHKEAQATDEEGHRKEDDVVASEPEESGPGMFGLGQLMSGVSSITRLVESTGSRVITGGLDTLETIGKKTMEVLQEGDPGLKNKRAFFNEKTVLSQVLREAKQRAETEDLQRDERQQARKAHFETLFDDYQGLVHLEALEMLSKQCELKMQSTLLAASGPALVALQRSHQEIKDLCRLPDEEDEAAEDTGWQDSLSAATTQLPVPFLTSKIFKTWCETAAWLPEEGQNAGAREVHRKAMESLARLTAESVEQFHKVAELLLVKEDRDPTKEAQLFVQVTCAVTSGLNVTAAQFSEHLSKCPTNPSSPDEVSNLITNIFFEANNSSSYVEEALRLLVSVLQVGLEN